VRDPGLVTLVPPWDEHDTFVWNWRLAHALRSGHVPMVIERDRVEQAVDVVPQGPTLPATVRWLRRAGPQLPSVFVFLGLAALLARRAREDRACRTVTYAFALFAPCWTVNYTAPSWPYWLFVVAPVVLNTLSIAALSFFCAFAWTFPTRSTIADSPWPRRLLVGLGAVAGGAAIVNTFAGTRLLLRGFGPQYVWNSLLAAVMVAGLVWQWRRARGIVARRQSALLIGSVVVGFGVPIAYLVVWSRIADHVESRMGFAISFQMPILVALAFAMSVARFRPAGRISSSSTPCSSAKARISRIRSGSA
jgi:hypothetical protein